MKFGICTSVNDAAAVKSAGWDYVEENVQQLLQGTLPDERWKNLSLVKSANLVVPAANSLVPGSLKITGPAVDFSALKQYMTKVIDRASRVGITTLVFGSGAARNVPEGFDRNTAVKQITDFARMSAELAAAKHITIVAEPLNRGECNIINTVAEAMEYVKAIDHPYFKCLVDSYHFWLENESLENLTNAMPWIRHVHLADTQGRVAPGLSGKADYRPFFAVLKRANYNGLISFEGTPMTNFADTAPKVLEFVKKQWNEA